MRIEELKLSDHPYKRRRGLAESLARRYFLKRGFEVFRGDSIFGSAHSFNYHIYDNVKRSYDRIEEILSKRLGDKLFEMRRDLYITRGLPDFFVHRKIDYRSQDMFVEIKMEHEPIRRNQLHCMRLLEEYGFDVAVLRIKSRPYREVCEVDLSAKNPLKLSNRRVIVKQERLRLRY